ncbi:lysophospholipase [Planotetraspora sp. A-T 1434]|uniref:alpha/beta hydrolase n=1 Tax=Planotetraspora sp. A-T 1434 TaxID=2979219 RepID=UPI0021C00530|nr:lysophospholipase [Planotetraspora sp. A-T 1434]MCT9932183.1 lysophospholipase [Planotetraspora sp. A-T 1434]
MAEQRPKVSTAGVGIIDFAELPPGTETTVIPVSASDGGASRGVLYTRGDERTVVVVSHPRGDMSRHYAAPALLEAGYAFYAHQPRSLNNDVDCEHERLLLDLAAGLSHLKNEHGFEKIVLLGNSGGGSLLAFYQQQATTTPPGRLTDTASGDPLDLNAVDMPSADGVVLLAAHPGQGTFMLTAIDPSVIDEDDPLSVDPELDMYHPANGFREPPEPSTYSAEFLERYRAAQRARVARLDAKARALIAEQRRYKQKTQEPWFADLPLEERAYITRRAVVGNYMVVHRTEADPAYLDLSLHALKSTRKPASILGPRPDQTNYAPAGFGRLVTPRAWLSTWSGLSTRADLLKSVKSVHEPLLVINFTADSLAFSDESKAHFDAAPSEDKTLRFLDAEHFGYPLPEREKALQYIVEWLAPRFPAAKNR